jgi:hypothetical protein
VQFEKKGSGIPNRLKMKEWDPGVQECRRRLFCLKIFVGEQLDIRRLRNYLTQ